MVSAWPPLSFGESIILLHARKRVLHVQVPVTPQGAGSLMSFPGHCPCVTAFLLLWENFTLHDPREGRGRTERRGTWILPVSALVFSPEDQAVHPFCTPVVYFRSESETDLGPGTLCWKALQCLNLDVPLLEHACMLSGFSHVQVFATPWTVAHQTPLSMGLPREGYWLGMPFLLSGALPDPGIEPTSPALAGGFFTTEPLRKPEPQFTTTTKSLQSCLTLCDPIDGSPPGSPVYWGSSLCLLFCKWEEP